MKVLKFGGSSVATAESIRRVAAVVAAAAEGGPVVVVVSALGGVTDGLLEASRTASDRSGDVSGLLSRLIRRHRETLREVAAHGLLGAGELEAEGARIDRAEEELDDLLKGCHLLQEASPRTVDRIVSYGERLSSAIVAAALRAAGVEARAVDARRLIVTDDAFGNAQVDFDRTRARVREALLSEGNGGGFVPVVTGFIAATEEGETTTLGRGGSDFTASLLGAALDAEAVELWTDVDGVMNADPRLVPAARPVASMSYIELMEMSHFGAKVVYPPSVHPTRQRGIPLWIKNTFHPEAPGTLVASTEEAPGEAVAGAGDNPVRGIASIPSIALLRLEGDGMVGVPGIAGRLFGALARRGVSIILITQASSEHSICFAVEPASVRRASRAVAEEFALERRAGLVEELVVETDLSVVAMVGRGMRHRPGLAGRLFGVLGRHGINVRAIAQGSSELNVSIVVATEDEGPALRALHGAFFEAPSSGELPVVRIFLAGTGRVGGALLAQLAEHGPAVEDREGIRLQLAGVAGRSRCRFGELDPATVADDLEPASDGGLAALTAAALNGSPDPNGGIQRIFVDCTASTEVAAEYHRLLAAGVSVVTANKVRLAGPGEGYRSLMAQAAGRLYYETTVGAGLPVVRTLADLLATGDTLHRLEGLFSGTLTYLMDRLAQGEPFSQALRQAFDLGLTEPDPREDLSGRDVARKLLILGRLAGRELEPEDVEVEALLPPKPWNGLSLDAFWERLPELDEAFGKRVRQASEAGRRLVYLGSLDGARARVRPVEVAGSHPCSGVRGTDNLIALTTGRYHRTPLVIQGPGAGPEVTAAGVFADLLRAVAEGPKGARPVSPRQ